jgi:hypothetical protein
VFQDCTSLRNIVIPDSVTFIQWYSFYGSGLTSITIPNSVTNIEQAAFGRCASLTDVFIPNSVIYLAEDVFYRCTSLKSITIPNGVTRLLDSVFAGCTSLTDVTLPDHLIGFGESVFAGCTSLTSITIPSTVAGINIDTFANCPNLAGVYFEGNKPGYDSEAGVFNGSPFVTVFRHSGAVGWDSSYAGRPTAIWETRPSYSSWAASTGLNAQFPAANGPGDDADGDGVTNNDEWLAGTNPTQSTSRFELERAARPADLTASDQTSVPAGQRGVYFRSVPGRYYGVQSAGDLAGPWNLRAVRFASTSQTRFALPADSPQIFYRVIVLP